MHAYCLSVAVAVSVAVSVSMSVSVSVSVPLPLPLPLSLPLFLPLPLPLPMHMPASVYIDVVYLHAMSVFYTTRSAVRKHLPTRRGHDYILYRYTVTIL